MRDRSDSIQGKKTIASMESMKGMKEDPCDNEDETPQRTVRFALADLLYLTLLAGLQAVVAVKLVGGNGPPNATALAAGVIAAVVTIPSFAVAHSILGNYPELEYWERCIYVLGIELILCVPVTAMMILMIGLFL